MNDVKTSSARWYTTLASRLQTLTENLGITEDAATELKSFMFAIAKEQYMTGNKSGIRWARMNP